LIIRTETALNYIRCCRQYLFVNQLIKLYYLKKSRFDNQKSAELFNKSIVKYNIFLGGFKES